MVKVTETWGDMDGGFLHVETRTTEQTSFNMDVTAAGTCRVTNVEKHEGPLTILVPDRGTLVIEAL